MPFFLGLPGLLGDSVQGGDLIVHGPRNYLLRISEKRTKSVKNIQFFSYYEKDINSMSNIYYNNNSLTLNKLLIFDCE